MAEETQTVPDKHSNVVGGSNAARRIHCPASLAYETMVPEDKGSVYAQEGTVLHEIMTKLLLDPELDPDSILPFTFTHKDGWTYTVDEDTYYDLGEPALNAFLDFMDRREMETGGEFTYIVEKSCAMPGIDGAFGTSDIVWRCGDKAGVWDWKFGYGEVKAEDNEQLLFYARTAMHEYPEMFDGVDELILAIMQPQRNDEPDLWEGVDPEEPERMRIELVASIKEGQEKGKDARIAKGKHCDFARCKAVCPLHINPSVLLAERLGIRKDAEQEIAESDEPPLRDDEAVEDVTLSFTEMLPDLLELAEVAQDYAKEVFARAHNIAENDAAARDVLRDAGWVLKDKKQGARKWVAPEKTIKNGARYRGLKIDDFAPRSLISPTQLEKKLKAVGKEMPETWAKQPPSSGTTLVRNGGDVKEHQSGAEKAAKLGERLAHLR